MMRAVMLTLAVALLVVACQSGEVTEREAAAADNQAVAMRPYTQVIPGTGVSFRMTPIPGGTFWMGSPAEEAHRNDDEGPRIRVEIEPFWMGVHEVTWDEYELYTVLFHDAVGEPPLSRDRWADAVTVASPIWPIEFIPEIERMGREGHPAVYMTQYAARQYTKFLSKKTGVFYRLPTEAEWEYACRAGTTTAYHFGDDPAELDAYGWHFDNSQLDDGDGAYRRVGRKKPNPWGLYDMHGNVAEWVLDAYDAEHYQRFAGRTITWREALNWPVKRHPRVVRGGGWDSDPEDLRSAARIASTPFWSLRDPEMPKGFWWYTETGWVGFRVVRPLHEPSEEEKLRYWDADDEEEKALWERSGRFYRVLIEPPPEDEKREAKD